MFWSCEELPGLVIAGVLIDRLGRKYSMALLFVVCSIFLFPLVEHRSTTITTILMFGARASIMGTFTIAFIFAPEVLLKSIFLVDDILAHIYAITKNLHNLFFLLFFFVQFRYTQHQ